MVKLIIGGKVKIHRKKELLENDRIILESIGKLLRSSKLNEETTLEGTNTPEFKEGLVVYLSNLNGKLIEQISNKLKNTNKKTIINLPQPEDTDVKYYGSKSLNLIKKAIEHLSKDQIVDQNEVRLYNNGLSTARAIQNIYGKPVQADRGETFNKIRSYAVDLVKKQIEEFPGRPDKWCPADIYIYNDSDSVSKALSAEFLNIGDDSLNAQFQPDIQSTSKGILGISLKEEKAQAGAAGSFDKTLNRSDNYPESEKIENYSILSVAYHYEKSIQNQDKPSGISEISIAHASAKNLEARKIPGSEKVISELEKTLELTLGTESLPSASTSGGKYSKDKVQSIFLDKKIQKVKYSPELESAIQKLYDSSMEKILDEYTKMRDQFHADLKSAGFNPPSEKLDPKTMGVKRTLGKAGCYKTASYLVGGLNIAGLKIPKEFKTIIQQKNAFVALAAYAIGMAGISPTFFKMVGSSAQDGVAKVETFYGDGFLNLDDDSKVLIEDLETRSGFRVTFVAKITLKNNKKSKTIKKYSVDIKFQSGGDFIKVEVAELKESE
jgi:hypothetical protein